MTAPATKRAYWRKDGDDLFRDGGYRLVTTPDGRVLTHDGVVLGTGLTLREGKDLANRHEDGT